MQTYDLLMLAVLGGLTLYGYFKGMAWQVAYTASFVVSYFAAVRFADQVAPNITFVNPPANKFVAMFIIYAVCSFFVWMLFRVVSKMIDSVKMEGFDHQMGAIIGFVRGVLWCVGITFFAVTLLPDSIKPNVINTKSGGYIAQLIHETDAIFPPEVREVIGPYLDRLHQELHPNEHGGQQNYPGNQQAAQQPNQQNSQQTNQLVNAAAGIANNALQNWNQNSQQGQSWGQNNAAASNTQATGQNANWQNSWGQPAQAAPVQNNQQQGQPNQPANWPAWP